MRALVMAAGLGTRLKPLTNETPKPLVPLRGRPMVEFVLDQLARAGVTDALINVHYLPTKMYEFVEAWNLRGGVPRLQIQDEIAEILGAGGAVALAAGWLFERETSAYVCNSDTIATPDLQAMAGTHRRLRSAYGVECSLAVMKHAGAGTKYTGLRVAGERVTAFEKVPVPDPALRHFPGYYIIESAGAKRLPAAGGSFGVVDELWRPLAAEGKLGAWEYTGTYFDLGTVEDLSAAEAGLK